MTAASQNKTTDITGNMLLEAVQNPYVLVSVGVYNTAIDPTTTGITDSARA